MGAGDAAVSAPGGGPAGGDDDARLLALDTATSTACLVLGDGRGVLIARRDWRPGHGSVETIIGQLHDLLEEARLEPAALSAIIVGIGPGAFTGLRIGLATAKTLAHELDRPIVGIETTAGLALAAWWTLTSTAAAGPRTLTSAASGPPRRITVVSPAGPGARYLARYRVSGSGPQRATPTVAPLEAPRLLLPAEVGDGEADLVAVDLDGGTAGPVASSAAGRGAAALHGLGAALLVLGTARLASGGADDVAALVPTYVSLPRGAPAQGVAWSPDLR